MPRRPKLIDHGFSSTGPLIGAGKFRKVAHVPQSKQQPGGAHFVFLIQNTVRKNLSSS